MSDDELVEKIKCGDEAAAKELIDRYYGAILRYCGWHCAASEKAEDLTQETFLKLFRNLPKYRGRNQAFTWRFVCGAEGGGYPPLWTGTWI